MRFLPDVGSRRGRRLADRAALFGLTLLLGLLASGPPAAAQEDVPSVRVLTLDSVLSLALDVDPAAVSARTGLAAARASRLQARGALMPSLSTNLIYGNSSNQRFDQTTGRLVSESYTTQVQGSYEIFGGGRRLAQLRASGADVDAAEASLRAQRFQTILMATQAYFAAAAAQDLVNAAEARLERARKQQEFAATRLEVGTATQSDALRSELEVGNAEVALLDAETSLEAASLDLGRIAGLADPVRPSPGTLPASGPELPAEEELVARALRISPDVLAANATLTARKADRLASWSAYVPSLRATGGYDWFAFSFPPNQQSWSLRLIASFPLFNGFQREAALQRAGAQMDLAQARARDAELRVRADVRTTARAIGTAQRRVQIADRGVELAREDLRVQEERYQIGVATIVELQTSQLALADAEAESVRARQALGTSVAELEAILGERIPAR